MERNGNLIKEALERPNEGDNYSSPIWQNECIKDAWKNWKKENKLLTYLCKFENDIGWTQKRIYAAPGIFWCILFS